MSSTIFDSRNLNQRVYSLLKSKIINNELKPGTRIDFNHLSDELGVSKTPVREAVQLLQKDCLIEVRSRYGTFVSQPNLKDIEEIYEVRKALERHAVKLAMDHFPTKELEMFYKTALTVEQDIEVGNYTPFFQADREFHKAIVTYSKNIRLIQMLESIEAQKNWIGVIVATSKSRPQQANNKHKEILKALLNRDITLSQNLMEEHLEEVKQMIIKEFKK